jgi:hypothetical protein
MASPVTGAGGAARPGGAPGSDWFDIALVAVCALSLGYWGLFALLSPVTVWDAHAYNLARLPLIERYGLFGNAAWNYQPQIIWPWAFDAVHYPLLKLRAGFGLPSYACLGGSLAALWYWLATRYSRRTAWLFAAGVLAMPQLVYQAVVTKNDVALLLGTACWFVALEEYRRLRSLAWVAWMAVALGFMGGAKSLGLAYALMLAAVSIAVLRRDRRALTWFAGSLAVAMLLLGSVETYVNNRLMFGHWQGDPAFVDGQRNGQGLRGAVANTTRYLFGFQDVGADLVAPEGWFAERLASVSNTLLDAVRLSGVGVRRGIAVPAPAFVRNGSSAGSTFGLTGTIGLFVSLGLFVLGSPRTWEWRFSVAGLVGLVVVAYAAGWMPWNLRFLTVPAVAFWLATCVWLAPRMARLPGVRPALLAAVVAGAFAYPLVSPYMGPRALVASVRERDVMMFRERDTMLAPYCDARAHALQRPDEPLLLFAGGDAWVLPFCTMDGLRWEAVSRLGVPGILERARALPGPTVRMLVLARRCPPFPAARVVAQYSEPGSCLVEIDARR